MHWASSFTINEHYKVRHYVIIKYTDFLNWQTSGISSCYSERYCKCWWSQKFVCGFLNKNVKKIIMLGLYIRANKSVHHTATVVQNNLAITTFIVTKSSPFFCEGAVQSSWIPAWWAKYWLCHVCRIQDQDKYPYRDI